MQSLLRHSRGGQSMNEFPRDILRPLLASMSPTPLVLQRSRRMDKARSVPIIGQLTSTEAIDRRIGSPKSSLGMGGYHLP